MSSDPTRADLELLAQGIDPISRMRMSPGGAPIVPMADRLQAVEALARLDAGEREQARLDAEQARLDAEQARLDRQQEEAVRAQRHQEYIEEQKLGIERAKVVVQALEVAAKGGVEPTALLGAIKDFTGQLLPGPAEALRQIEAHDEDA